MKKTFVDPREGDNADTMSLLIRVSVCLDMGVIFIFPKKRGVPEMVLAVADVCTMCFDTPTLGYDKLPIPFMKNRSY